MHSSLGDAYVGLHSIKLYAWLQNIIVDVCIELLLIFSLHTTYHHNPAMYSYDNIVYMYN